MSKIGNYLIEMQDTFGYNESMVRAMWPNQRSLSQEKEETFNEDDHQDFLAQAQTEQCATCMKLGTVGADITRAFDSKGRTSWVCSDCGTKAWSHASRELNPYRTQ